MILIKFNLSKIPNIIHAADSDTHFGDVDVRYSGKNDFENTKKSDVSNVNLQKKKSDLE